MLDGIDYNEFGLYMEQEQSQQGLTTAINFQQFDINNFLTYLRNSRISREIKSVHIHHTWKPDYSNFTGSNHNALQNAMHRFHTGVGFGGIAQHITIFPDGQIVLGRDFNQTPASISGHNIGAFCIEQIGNFDKGKDIPTLQQINSLVQTVRFLTRKFNANIMYHSETNTKTCPGSGFMSKQDLQNLVNNDLEGHWAEKEFKKFIELGIIGGFPDGTFRPNEPLTRAQFVVAMDRALTMVGQGYKEFNK